MSENHIELDENGAKTETGSGNVDKIIREKCYLTVPTGEKIFCRYWKPKPGSNIKALVFVCHGFAEHLEWYDELGAFLAENGYLAFGHDHLGHGLSDGNRGLVESIDFLVSHVIFHAAKVKMENQSTPCYIYGHSMGGLVTLKSVLHNAAFFKGMVLEGPLVKMADEHMGAGKYWGASLVSRYLPEFQVGTGITPENITSDPDVMAKIPEDALRYNGGMKIKTFYSFASAVREVLSSLNKFTLPFLIMHGEHDVLCTTQGSQELHSKAKSKDKQLIIFPGAKHHLLIEAEDKRTQLLSETLNWLEERCGGNSDVA